MDPFFLWIVFPAGMTFQYVRARKALLATEGIDLWAAAAWLKRIYLVACLPWAVVAVGQLWGDSPSLAAYGHPRDGDPFVLALHACLAGESFLFIWWIFRGHGAQTLLDLKLMPVLRWHVPHTVRALRCVALLTLVFPLWSAFCFLTS